MLEAGGFTELEKPTATRWDDLRVPLSTAKPGATKVPDFAKWTDNGAGSTGLFAYRFDPTTAEEVFFDAQLPHAYEEGSRIAPHLHYVLPTAPTNGQTLRFGLEYAYANVGGTFANSTIIYATETFTGDEAVKTQYIAGFDPDIEDPDMRVSAMFCCRLFRDAANDTYPYDAVVLEFDFHYQIDALGSVNELAK